jgi:hypothetical protein
MSYLTLNIERLQFKHKTNILSNDFYGFNKIILKLQTL